MSRKKMLLMMTGALALLVVVFAIVVATRPADFSVSRSVVIHAPAQRVFPYLNNMQMGMDWSPFEKLDPQMNRTLSGPEEGVGATYSWAGNREAGVGTVKIIESIPNQFVKLQLDFKEPMEATSYTTYTLTPVGENQVRLTWEMTGRNNFIGKAICMFMDMDAMVGSMFEEGLANLKRITENPEVTPSSPPSP